MGQNPSGIASRGAARCAACGSETSTQGWDTSGGDLCASCASRQEAGARQTAASPAMALSGGALGALVAALMWAVAAVGTETEFGFGAVAVGLLAGWGVKLGAGSNRGRFHQVAGASFSVLGLLLAKYFIFAHFAAEAWNAEGADVGYFEPAFLLEFPFAFLHMVSGHDALWAIVAAGAAWKIVAPPPEL